MGIGLVVMLASNQRSFASEYGVSTYRTGIMDMFAGYLAPPGATILKNFTLFQDARADATTANGRIQVHAHTVTYTDALFGAHVTGWRILGSYWAFGAIVQTRLADQTLRAGPAGHQQRQTDTVFGLGDLIVSPWLLGWSFGRFHLMHSLMLYAPTGSYERHRIIDLGLNRWSVEPDVGMTWMDEETGRQASAFIGYTINSPNTSTHYWSGDEFHADFLLAQHLPRGITLGMAGYALQQTTADTGSGAEFGPFKGRVIALGPLGGVTVKIWNVAVHISVKYDFEFAAQNRLSGNELWLTAACPL
ncbi:MAG: transporter [Candidatus Binatus sp.]|uniref:SphA family protein n=1 Tax=Candidatus Binatus sp. TaxID=2811406 RepID=UPI00271564D2|nr:transporter [Candidatus Binatus sp.]MDO8434814.1 transporter [Candidatus Binatus sp.]